MKTLLYLEDDEDDRFLFAKAVKETGFECNVLFATSNSDLFAILDKDVPDIIFLDFNLPDENGIKCLRQIRSMDKWKEVPVAMYSTYINNKIVQASSEEKADLYIQKPYHYENIVEVLKDVFTNNWKPHQLPFPKDHFKNDLFDPFSKWENI